MDSRWKKNSLRVSFFLLLLTTGFIWQTNSSKHKSNLYLGETTVSVELKSFGKIAYRAPLANTKLKDPIVLIHGIYRGNSHRSFSEVSKLLDSKGERVFLVDLPGMGNSDKPKRIYTVEDIDQFLEEFLQTVVKEPATVVAESSTTMSALMVAKKHPELFHRLVLISPTGINRLNAAPNYSQVELFESLYNNNSAGDTFYNNLMDENAVTFFVKRSYFDDMNSEPLQKEIRVAAQDKAQKWILISLVTGKIFRSFVDAAKDINIPTLLIFGDHNESINNIPMVDDSASFQNLRPDLQYLVIKDAGRVVHKEKANEVAQAILHFAEIPKD
jgi:pimeloyl-ACP methyl ester carboxylesterase